ncbi:Alpha/Beta hydrolase protein [Xylariales sp. AK1849]|nr:Alpha/Beta hydrolase protein [Xylariales sp. AK1849]
MSTQQTAKTRFAIADDETKFAYRRIGTNGGPPLLLLTHFRGVMDRWDPLLINSLSAHRSLILFDYVGVGHSVGEIATTIQESADHVLRFLQLIGETEIDLLGFSIGGYVAQLVALNSASTKLRVRKLILAGTGPSIGPDVAQSSHTDVAHWAGAKELPLKNFQVLFFHETREGVNASEAWWDRIHERTQASSGEELSEWLSLGYVDDGKGIQAQSEQLKLFQSPESTQGLAGSYQRLGELDIPVLVSNGNDDYMVPSINSWVLQQKLPRAQLIIYPDSGHGFLFQYAQQFTRDVVYFLEA